jgi:8-oxo-dGDP phosphatase
MAARLSSMSRAVLVMSDDESNSSAFGPAQTHGQVHLVKREIGCRNSKWTVYLDHIHDDQGNEVHDFIVVGGQVPRHDLVTGVCVLPVWDGRIGLLRYYRHAVAEALWEVPRGFIDQGEEPAEAALRELEEETGLTCRPTDVLPLGFYLPEPSTLQARGGVFVAARCQPGKKREKNEIGLGELSLFTLEEVANMAESSQIQDASTLIAFYRYADWLRHAD